MCKWSVIRVRSATEQPHYLRVESAVEPIVCAPKPFPWLHSCKWRWDFIRIYSLLNSKKYKQICNYPSCSTNGEIGPKFMLQHDNDPKHTANVIKKLSSW